MKTRANKFSPRLGQIALLFLAAAIVAACGGSAARPEPTPTPVVTIAPAATTAPASSDDAASEPEAQPESPLLQPESPLTTTGTGVPRTEEDAIALAAITTAPEPSEGFGTISGVLFSFGSVPGAIPGTQVYLEEADEVDGEFFPPAVSLGPQLDEGDIIVESNKSGQVQLEIPPGSYYMAVWTLYDWLLAVSESGEEAPRLITVEEGDQIELGVLYVDWP